MANMGFVPIRIEGRLEVFSLYVYHIRATVHVHILAGLYVIVIPFFLYLISRYYP